MVVEKNVRISDVFLTITTNIKAAVPLAPPAVRQSIRRCLLLSRLCLSKRLCRIPAHRHDRQTSSARWVLCSIRRMVSPFSFQFGDGFIAYVDNLRHQTQREFIDEKHFRSRHHCAADGQHLLLTSGKRSCYLSEPFPQPGEKGQNPVDVFPGKVLGVDCTHPRSGFLQRSGWETAADPRVPQRYPSATLSIGVA